MTKLRQVNSFVDRFLGEKEMTQAKSKLLRKNLRARFSLRAFYRIK
jgi:hypothetical protein